MADEVKTKTATWVKVVLAISLALNFLVIGAVAGIALRVGPVVKEARQSAGPAGFAPMIAALQPHERRDLGKSIRDGLSVQPRQGRAEMRRFLVIVRSEPFDRSAAWAIIETHGTVTTERLTKGQKLLMDKIEAMSPAERQAYAMRLEEALKRRSGKSKGPKSK